jgi:hypothetical protein
LEVEAGFELRQPGRGGFKQPEFSVANQVRREHRLVEQRQFIQGIAAKVVVVDAPKGDPPRTLIAGEELGQKYDVSFGNATAILRNEALGEAQHVKSVPSQEGHHETIRIVRLVILLENLLRPNTREQGQRRGTTTQLLQMGRTEQVRCETPHRVWAEINRRPSIAAFFHYQRRPGKTQGEVLAGLSTVVGLVGLRVFLVGLVTLLFLGIGFGFPGFMDKLAVVVVLDGRRFRFW